MSVTILIPVYNDGAFVRQTIASIKNQTHSDFICLINDDVSTDNTREEVRSTIDGDDRFVLVCQEINGGGFKNESTLFLMAKEQYRRKYTFIFSGHDIVSPRYLEEATKFLEVNHDYAMASGVMRAFVETPQSSSDLPESEYPFFKQCGLLAFLNSAIQLGNCTIFNSVFRSDCCFDKDVFPLKELMRGHDHLMISWMASYGLVHISRETTYFRRFFPPDRDHRPSCNTRIAGVANVATTPSQDELHRAMIRNYLLVFRARFVDRMSEQELSRFEQFLFTILYRRFGYNVL